MRVIKERGRNGGFTMVEAVIVVAMVAILTSFVYPVIIDMYKRFKGNQAHSDLVVIESAKAEYLRENYGTSADQELTELMLAPYLPNGTIPSLGAGNVKYSIGTAKVPASCPLNGDGLWEPSSSLRESWATNKFYDLGN